MYEISLALPYIHSHSYITTTGYESYLFYCAAYSAGILFGTTLLQKLYPVNYSQVIVSYPFWKSRMETVATSTIGAYVQYTENKTARIRNFEKAAAGSDKHEGTYYDD